MVKKKDLFFTFSTPLSKNLFVKRNPSSSQFTFDNSIKKMLNNIPGKSTSIKKQQQWKAFSPNMKNIMRSKFKDSDGDRIPNKWDCQPRNIMRQDSQIYLSTKQNNNQGLYVKPSEPKKIYMGDAKLFTGKTDEDINLISNLISHEEMHQDIQRNVGRDVSSQLDSITPTIVRDKEKKNILNKTQAGLAVGHNVAYPQVRAQAQNKESVDEFYYNIVPERTKNIKSNMLENFKKDDKDTHRRFDEVWDKDEANKYNTKEERNEELKKLRHEYLYPRRDEVLTYREPINVQFGKGDTPLARQASAGEGGHIEWMTPDQFLNLATPANINQSSIINIVDSIKKGNVYEPGFLEIDNNNQVYGHEGRHRAYAAKIMMLKHIPVAIVGSGHQLFNVYTTKKEQSYR